MTTYRSFATTESQQSHNRVTTESQQSHNSKFVIFQKKRLKVLKCCNFLWVQRRHGEFCKLRYDIKPVKSASANVSFYNNNSKMPNFELWHSYSKCVLCKLMTTLGTKFPWLPAIVTYNNRY